MIMDKDLTSGNVWKNILLFSLPYMLSFFLQTLYGMADLFIIGQFNATDSITAVSIGSQVMHMLTVMIVGLAMGATVTIGLAAGAKELNKASRLVGNTAVLFITGSFAVTVLLLLLVNPIVTAMSAPPEAALKLLLISEFALPVFPLSPLTISSAPYSGVWETPNGPCISLPWPVSAISLWTICLSERWAWALWEPPSAPPSHRQFL